MWMTPVRISYVTIPAWVLPRLCSFKAKDQSTHARLSPCSDIWTTPSSLILYLLDIVTFDPVTYIYWHWLSRFADLARTQFLAHVQTTLFLPRSVRTFAIGCSFLFLLIFQFVGLASVFVSVSYICSENTHSLFLSFPDMCKQPLSVVILICCHILTKHPICFSYYSSMVPVDWCIQFQPIIFQQSWNK